MMTRMNAEIFNYACSLAPISLTELSRSWCEHETISLESVYGTIISTAFLVVVLESCERYFDSVCLNCSASRIVSSFCRVEQYISQHLHISQQQYHANWTQEKDIGNGGVCCLRTSN